MFLEMRLKWVTEQGSRILPDGSRSFQVHKRKYMTGLTCADSDKYKMEWTLKITNTIKNKSNYMAETEKNPEQLNITENYIKNR